MYMCIGQWVVNGGKKEETHRDTKDESVEKVKKLKGVKV